MKDCLIEWYQIAFQPEAEIVQFPPINIDYYLLKGYLEKSDNHKWYYTTNPTKENLYWKFGKELIQKSYYIQCIKYKYNHIFISISFCEILEMFNYINKLKKLEAFW